MLAKVHLKYQKMSDEEKPLMHDVTYHEAQTMFIDHVCQVVFVDHEIITLQGRGCWTYGLLLLVQLISSLRKSGQVMPDAKVLAFASILCY